MSRYVKERRAALTKQAVLLDRNDGVLAEWESLKGLEDDLPGEQLRRLISFTSNNLTELREQSRGQGDARMERLLVDGSRVLQDMVEAQREATLNARTELEKVRSVVELLLQAIAPCIAGAYLAVQPEGLPKFKAELSKRLDGLDHAALDTDISVAYMGSISHLLEPAWTAGGPGPYGPKPEKANIDKAGKHQGEPEGLKVLK